MTITLTSQESEKYFYSALCNGVSYMCGYGLEFDYKDADYTKARRTIQKKIESGKIPHEMYVCKGEKRPDMCIEDIWMEILRNGGKLTFNDIEGNGENTKSITLADVHARVQKTPIKHLTDMINENDDATTADVILQTVFFEEVIFG